MFDIKSNNAIIYFIFIIFMMSAFSYFSLAKSQEELSADEITIITDDLTQEIIAQGNVLFLFSEISLETNKARFIVDKQQLLINEKLSLKLEDLHVEANNLVGDLKREEFKFFKGVKLTHKQLLLEGEEMVYQHAEAEITVSGQPFLELEEIRVTAETIIYNLETEKVLLTGNVQGSYQGQKFFSESLILDISESEIVLSGKARFIFTDKGE